MHVNALDNDIQCDTCEPIVFFHPESHSEVGVGKEHQSGSVLLSGVCCPLEGKSRGLVWCRLSHTHSLQKGECGVKVGNELFLMAQTRLIWRLSQLLLPFVRVNLG